MRSDMKHKIVERPRFKGYGNGDAIRKDRAAVRCMDAEQLEELPAKVGMRKPHIVNWSNKELNENLNPLFRYLNKQAGRPWNKVYSEICEQIRPSSATQLHILQHINDIVETKVIIVDGVACHKSMPYWSRQNRTEFVPIRGRGNGSYKQMYACPKSGLLRFAPDHEKRQKRAYDPDLLMSESPYTQYRRINGIWYQVNFRDLEDKDVYNRDKEGRLVPEWRQRVVARSILWPDLGNFPLLAPFNYCLNLRDWEWAHRGRIVPIMKRQLNSKEIKRFGLNNRDAA